MRYTSKRGKRSGRSRSFSGETAKQIHARIDGLPSAHNAGHSHNINNNRSTTAVAAEAAKYYECALIDESRETHIIPRQSITRKQLLGVKPQQLEMAPIPTRQLDKRSGEIVETTDNRLAWKSDRTLLNLSNPFKNPEDAKRAAYKREGTVSVGLDRRKYRENIDNPAPMDVTTLANGVTRIEERPEILGAALEDDPFVEPVVTLTDEEIAAAFDVD